MNRTALVTGGAGFIGSHICERLLENGYKVIALDNVYTGSRENIRHIMGNDNFIFIEQDILEPITLQEPVHQIYHLACPASPVHYQRDPVYTIKTAFNGTLNVLEFARKEGVVVLHASTSEVYGDPQVHPQVESYNGNVNPVGPRACYDEGKRAAETLCSDYMRMYNLDVRTVRIFNTYGPRMAINDGRVVSNFIVQALKGESITVFGDGSQTRSFCYVDDLVSGILAIMNAEKNYGPINLGNPDERTIAQLAQLICEQAATQSVVEFKELPTDDPTKRKPDIEKIRALLGWEPRVNLEEGIQKTLAYFKTVL